MSLVVTLFQHVQAAHVKRLFAAAHEEHAIALKRFRQQAAEQEASDVQWEQLQATEGVGLASLIPEPITHQSPKPNTPASEMPAMATEIVSSNSNVP